MINFNTNYYCKLKGTKDAAIRQYQRALEINPNHRIAAVNLAQINMSHQLGMLILFNI